MGLEKILSIAGKPGLYEVKTQTRAGFVAESLLDGKKMPVNLRHDVRMLSEIAIYTDADEVPLAKVFEKIYNLEDGKRTIDHKESKDKLFAHFAEILPDYDKDRVYQSDIKKVFQWYNQLIDSGITSFLDTDKEIETDQKGEEE